MAAVAAVVLAGLLGASPAAADSFPVDPTTPTTVTADGLPTVQIDGVVWSQVVVGNTVYAAGSFQTARPAGAAPGVNTVARHNLLAFDIVTGNLIDSFAPDLNGQALSIAASPDGTRIYVVGDFTQVNGLSRVRAAAFDTATGQLVGSFSPTLSARGRAVTASNDTVYIGGDFTGASSVTGGTLVPRAHLAAFTASTGTLTAFVADADAAVNALAATVDGAKVVVGGNFTTLSGVATYGLGAVSPTSGASIPFPANQYIRDAGPYSSITSLYADASGVYGTGYIFGAGGNTEGPFRADATTGALIWVGDCHGDSYSAFPQGNAIYVASHEHYCGNIGGFPQSNPLTHYHATAFTKAVTGVNTADIYGYPSHAGQPAPSLLTWFPEFTMGTYTGQNQATWSVTGNGSYVVYGGEFPAMNGTAQQGLVRFATSAIAPNKQGPRITGANFNPSAISIVPGEVRVRFTTNWDRDNETLTYRLYRGSEKSAPIYSEDITTPFWKVLSRDVADPGLLPGSTQSYLLSATDHWGNVVKSQWVTSTVASASLSAYPLAVLGDSAGSYWRLGEPSGTGVVDWAGALGMTAGSGVARGTAGAIVGDADNASTFDGSGSGFAATSVAQPGPDTFTAEAWIKTISTSGGKIIGFGDANTGNSSTYDRQVYMDNAGHIWFGVNPGSVQTLSSAATFNDGQWHHVVASLGSNGMRLYVDAGLVGQRTDVTGGGGYYGYWRIGGDNLGGWTNQPSSNYFNGAIDEVAVYPTVLSAHTVATHYTLGSAAQPPNQTPTGAQGYIQRVYGDLFNRAPDPAGLAAWTTALSTGTPRVAVANAITSSTEYRTGLITGSYQHYLGRTPDAGGLAFWLGQMNAGWTISRMESGFIASAEYYARAGSTPAGWAGLLYTDVLGRPAGSSEVAYWVQQIGGGMPRDAVAMGFLLSTERLNTVVAGYYQHLLGRGIDLAGQAYWVGILQAGGRNEAIIGGIIASQEYYGIAAVVNHLALAPAPATITTGASQAYTAQGFDAYGSALGDVTGQTTFTMDASTACPAMTCAPTTAGDHTITATHGTATATTTLHVVADATARYPAWAWGDNATGQLGNGTTANESAPGQVGTDPHWSSIAAGLLHTVAVKADGTLWAWGYNAEGQLGDGTTTERSAPVQVGNDTHWAQVAAGSWQTVALKTDGTLWAWGYNGDGELGDGTTSSRLAPVQVGTDTGWASIAAGGRHTVATKTDGTLWAWGLNSNGQLGDGTTVSRLAPVQVGTDTHWASVATGQAHTVATKTDGTLWTWGWNASGQLGNGAAGTTQLVPGKVGADTHWALAQAGFSHTSAVKSDGTLWAWGDNSDGQLGDGTTTSRFAPEQVGVDTNWATIAAGSNANHTSAIKTDGTLWAWGYNGDGQLGDGTTTNRSTPLQVGSYTHWAAVTVGSNHTVALRS